MTRRNITVDGMRQFLTVNGFLFSMIKHWKNFELRRLAEHLNATKGDTVLSGPFTGMRFGNRKSRPAHLPKLIGSYECELHEIFQHAIDQKFSTIINVGSADGYYAVGMALKCPQARVYAFEMDEQSRSDCVLNARANHVEERISALGECDQLSLMKMPLEGSLILMDCEGAELDILSETIAPRLARTCLLIELHDVMRAGCGRIIWQRYEKTHDMKFIPAVSHPAENFFALAGLKARQQAMALDESRMGAQEWVYMTPKNP